MNKNISAKSTIYITGSTCDLGLSIIKKLDFKKFKIVALVRKVEQAKKLHKNDDIIYLEFDLNKPQINIDIDKNSILIHCAWENPRDVNSQRHINSVITQHCVFMEKIINQGIRKVIVVGTCAEFGLSYGPVSANDETSPCTNYGSSKDLLHKALRLLEKRYSFDLVWLRIFNVYGESINKNTVTSLFKKAIRDGLTEFPMSKGEQIFDYLHINDIAARIVMAIDKESGIYHVCSSKPIKLKDLLTKFKKESNSSIKLKLGTYPYRNHEPIAIWGKDDDLKLS